MFEVRSIDAPLDVPPFSSTAPTTLYAHGAAWSTNQWPNASPPSYAPACFLSRLPGHSRASDVFPPGFPTLPTAVLHIRRARQIL